MATVNSPGPGEPPSPDPTPSVLLRNEERGGQVRQAVASIPDEKDREVTRLYYLEEMSLREIAGRLGMTYDQARTHKDRGREWLSEALYGAY